MTRRIKVTGDLFHGQVPDGAVYVGRAAPGLKGSRYANPYTVAEHGREEDLAVAASVPLPADGEVTA